jgi:hypothetical protein
MSGETARAFIERILVGKEDDAEFFLVRVKGKVIGDVEFFAKHLAERDAQVRRDALEEAAKIADTEEVPDTNDPACANLAHVSPALAAIAGVTSTKSCIAERIRRAARQPCPARREDVATD